MAGRWSLGGDLALGNLACDVGDEFCNLVFDPGMDMKESSHTGGAVSELLGGFTLLALALCGDIADVVVVDFLSEPEELLAFADGSDNELTFGVNDPREGHSLFEICRSLNCLRFRRWLVRAWHEHCQWSPDYPSRAW